MRHTEAERHSSRATQRAEPSPLSAMLYLHCELFACGAFLSHSLSAKIDVMLRGEPSHPSWTKTRSLNLSPFFPSGAQPGAGSLFSLGLLRLQDQLDEQGPSLHCLWIWLPDQPWG